ncbi:MAG: DUF3047 domain-containing protein [Spirochaetales bacterium]|nr:DUF3047 domain-containing protein [Spirochaetales bacterium]
MKMVLAIILSLCFMFTISASEWFISEEFENLENWEPLLFPKIEEHSHYSISVLDGESILKAESDSSASGLIFKEEFDVYEWPLLDWRWRVDELIEGGDGRKKSGDDYAIRIYVVFEYNPAEASGFRKVQYNLARVFYGEFPPDSGLNYVWANRDWGEEYIANPFTDQALMVASDSGRADLGTWREHRINILEDYRELFGDSPPAKASIAIMSDSDNTGSTGYGYIDYIRIGR